MYVADVSAKTAEDIWKLLKNWKIRFTSEQTKRISSFFLP